MLGEFPVYAVLAATDLERAKQWYKEKLDLAPDKEESGGLWFRTGGDTWLFLYQTPSAGTAQNTVASWQVKGIESVMEELRSRGVVFEEYDMPGVTMKDGLATMGPFKAAWFKDSEGNIQEITEVSE